MAVRRDKDRIIRRRFALNGIVQGVGFRPFVYRQARNCNLTGWVRNTPAGVEIEVEGQPKSLSTFERSLTDDIPPLAVITSYTSHEVPAIHDTDFSIQPSVSGTADIQVAPDSKLCCDCLRELFDPSDRRYRYPFITCTNCGPRYSIITAIPYDRAATTMAGFPLCQECLDEYHDPSNRRFHAQPVACPVCGPAMTLMDDSGRQLASGNDAVVLAAQQLLSGSIVAIKGIGGYHLAVDACNHHAVIRLRQRKKRDEKPFAVMAASLEMAQQLAMMSELEERLLSAPEAPIVITRKRPCSPVSSLVAPGNGWIGLMLPYAPQHHLLFSQGQEHAMDVSLDPGVCPPDPTFNALVMTSGNISDEPIAYRDEDALSHLSGIADFLLVHNRPIHIREDDSVLRVFQGRPIFYRRSRGYAPRAVRIPFECTSVLAVGAELKNAICLTRGSHAFLSQHIGDLKNDCTGNSFRESIDHLGRILEITPMVLACDLHPDYISTHAAENIQGTAHKQLIRIQHHHAHLAACMAENCLEGEAIGVIFDGTGYGDDGTIWGGEFLVGGYEHFTRAAHFSPAQLPGGDAAVREPWRMALSYLHISMGDAAFTINHPITAQLTEAEKEIFTTMLLRGINSPMTTSCGRLFDAVAALLNIRHIVSYDGQAAIELEACAESAEQEDFLYPFEITHNSGRPMQLSFIPLFPAIMADLNSGISTAVIARRFHASVARGTTEVCQKIARQSGCDRVVLSGGVFQNRLLTELVYSDLTNRGLQVFTHSLVPPNDGGIALGQAAIAGWKTRRAD